MCTLYSVIVQVFREGDEQAQAIGLFGLSGALGNVMGLVIAVSVFFVWTAKMDISTLLSHAVFSIQGVLMLANCETASLFLRLLFRWTDRRFDLLLCRAMDLPILCDSHPAACCRFLVSDSDLAQAPLRDGR